MTPMYTQFNEGLGCFLIISPQKIFEVKILIFPAQIPQSILIKFELTEDHLIQTETHEKITAKKKLNDTSWKKADFIFKDVAELDNWFFESSFVDFLFSKKLSLPSLDE
jgi:hypothetical protein